MEQRRLVAEPLLARVTLRIMGMLGLAVLAMAAVACMNDDGPPMAPEGGDVGVDRAAPSDVSIDSDGSTKTRVFG